jgi:hypothetical protein
LGAGAATMPAAMRPPPEALAALASFVDAIESHLDELGVTATAAAAIAQSFPGQLRLAILPGVRARLAGDAELPADSTLGVLAIRAFDGDERFAQLTSMLSAFDASYRNVLRLWGGQA